MTISVRKLAASQTEAFDVEYISNEMFELVAKPIVERYSNDRPFNLLDVGGGNGIYADKVLEHFPAANVTVIEPEQTLLDKNRPHPRKSLLACTFQQASQQHQQDIIQFNWVLHHFVSNSYELTLQVQRAALTEAYQNLKPGGMVFIFENFYEGLWVSDMPGQVIYRLTASDSLKSVVARMGANTAGVGVCFHSESVWKSMLREAGFQEMYVTHCYEFGNLSPVKKACLGLKSQQVGFLVAVK
ncbi:class I SAM-dependent methyltransferase [Vibrio proteolyticus]|uniref:Methyltransferase n=1 Tax=Vibrio proteolyticus NBRC 13287 TaxID=1219065 RepID=U2ZHJ9_VIBPR|nr:class I SAM-dependent methyltransferase [Vibrio proteolyticus]GAD67161.1 hypothetical protein VPR01S_06_01790 [Vibrio proteolyticus NBRC 13287]